MNGLCVMSHKMPSPNQKYTCSKFKHMDGEKEARERGSDEENIYECVSVYVFFRSFTCVSTEKSSS